MRLSSFALYDRPRSATVNGEAGVKVVLGIQIRDGERVFYLVADEDPKHASSCVKPRFVAAAKVSLFAGG